MKKSCRSIRSIRNNNWKPPSPIFNDHGLTVGSPKLFDQIAAKFVSDGASIGDLLALMLYFNVYSEEDYDL